MTELIGQSISHYKIIEKIAEARLAGLPVEGANE
jgi:hypothetical protein